jgi:hypothetical protein
LNEWDQDFEPPPNPFHESQEEFEQRMRESWQRRVRAFHGVLVSRRKLHEHATWTVRFHVGRERPSRIAARIGIDNRDTVPGAIERFARLIELPLTVVAAVKGTDR